MYNLSFLTYKLQEKAARVIQAHLGVHTHKNKQTQLLTIRTEKVQKG